MGMVGCCGQYLAARNVSLGACRPSHWQPGVDDVSLHSLPFGKDDRAALRSRHADVRSCQCAAAEAEAVQKESNVTRTVVPFGKS